MKRVMGLAALSLATLTLIGIGGLDVGLANLLEGSAPSSIWSTTTHWLDLLALKTVSNFLLGALLLLAAILSLVPRKTRRLGWTILYVAAVHTLATVIADMSKPLFGRLRPFEAVADARGGDIWFVGANSFPSGHTAFYAGLFFPLVLLSPRWSVLWMAVPCFIATARVMEHDHYLSDVTASLALAAALTAGMSFIRQIGLGPRALERLHSMSEEVARTGPC